MKEKLKNLEEVVSSLLAQQGPLSAGRQHSDQLETSEEHLHPSLRKASSTTAYSAGSGSSPVKDDVLDKESPRALLGEDGQVHYVNPSHWLSVLEEIKEVREILPSDDAALAHDFSRVGVDPDVGFPFTQTEAVDIDEILASVPPPSVCRNLLSAYFNAGYAIPGTRCMVLPPEFLC